MSIGLNRSFQYSGLNRCGVFMQTAKDKGPEHADRSVGATNADRNVCATNGRPNEIWRRITGIFPGVKLETWQRKRGLRILARRIRERVQRTFTAETQRRGERRVSLVEEWDFEAESWARAEMVGVSVEGICVELGCRRHVLTSLLKEHCGVSASEFLDGVRISRVRVGMVERLKEAASELWGAPGSFAAVKLMNGGADIPVCLAGKNACSTKQSKYFRSKPEEMFGETRGEERARRVDELCAQIRDGTGGRATSGTLGTRGTRFELESWAVSCGYESGAKLKRACLNVFGRTLGQIERALACEVVQFYLCAEDRELRAIACSDRLSVEVARAREVYHGDEAKPESPFVDEWAKFEELKAEWLSRMGDEFG